MKKGFLWAGKNAFLGARTIWDKNLGADVHSKLGSTRAEVPIGVFFHELHHPSTQKPESRPPILTHQNQVGGHDARGWLDDRYNRLHPQWKTACKQDKSCPHRKEKQGLRLCWQKALQVWFPSVVLMKCIPCEEGKSLLEEIHEGTCGNHVASRTLVGKTFRSVFYWL